MGEIPVIACFSLSLFLGFLILSTSLVEFIEGGREGERRTGVWGGARGNEGRGEGCAGAMM